MENLNNNGPKETVEIDILEIRNLCLPGEDLLLRMAIFQADLMRAQGKRTTVDFKPDGTPAVVVLR